MGSLLSFFKKLIHHFFFKKLIHLFFKKLIHQIKTSVYQIFQPDPLCSFGVVSSVDELSESEEARVTTQEEYEVDGHGLKQGGASFSKRRGAGVIELGISLCLFFHCFMAKPSFCDRPLSSFPGAAFAVAY